MDHPLSRYAILSIVLLLAIVLRSDGQPPLAGDPNLPSDPAVLRALAAHESGTYPLSVADFMAYPRQSEFRLSPSGRYLSYLERNEFGGRSLRVRDLETDAVRILLLEQGISIRDYFWKDERRVVYSADRNSDELLRLFAINRDGSDARALTPFENVQIRLLHHGTPDSPELVIERTRLDSLTYELLRLDVYTGALRPLPKPLPAQEGFGDYAFDSQGRLRAYDRVEIFSEYVVYYRSPDDRQFREVARFDLNSWFQILRFSDDPQQLDQAYVLSNLLGDTKAIYRYDLRTQTVVEAPYRHPDYDLAELGWVSPDGRASYYTYEGVKPQVVPIQPQFQAVHERITERFPAKSYRIVGAVAEEERYLVELSSDRCYGQYWRYDHPQNDWQLLAEQKPQLREDQLVALEPFTFWSRDSLALSGYYLRPPGASAERPAPLILIPHGGPFDLRDRWEFIDYAQLFASRGYGVLFVNFRGSAGFGKAFQARGFGQVGRGIIDDLEDGLWALIDRGWVDAERVGLFGASHGGLASLQAMIRDSSAYACGVDLMGPSDLFSLFEGFPPYWQPYLDWFYTVWYHPQDSADAQIIRDVSPAFQLDRLRRPLLVVHGANDPRVRISESDRVVAGLRQRGREVPYVVRYNEGHRWTHEENIVELFEIILGFFAKHLKK